MPDNLVSNDFLPVAVRYVIIPSATAQALCKDVDVRDDAAVQKYLKLGGE